MSTSSPAGGGFIHSLCTQSDWSGDLPSFFNQWSDCFPDLGLLLPAHVCAMFALLGRQLFVNKYRSITENKFWNKLRSSDRDLGKIKILFSFIVMVIPLFQLNAVIYKYGKNVTPLEVLTLLLSASVWFLITTHFFMERNCYIPNHQEVLRVFIFICCVCNGIKGFIVYRGLPSDGFNYFFWLTEVESLCCVALILMTVFHWPGRFDRVGGTIVNAGYAMVTDLEAVEEIHASKAPVCPELESSIWSRIWFNWIGDLIEQGSEKPLCPDDVFSLDSEDRSATVHEKFKEAWGRVKNYKPINSSGGDKDSLRSPLAGNEVKSDVDYVHQAEPQRHLMAVLKDIFGFRFWIGGLYRILSDACQFVAPLLMANIIQLLGTKDDNPDWKMRGIFMVVGMFLSQVFGILFQSKYLHDCSRVGMQARSVMVAELFRKCLSMSRAGWAGVDMGKVNTMISGDTENLELACQSFHSLWSAPIRMIMALYFLNEQLGYSAFIGAAMLFVLLPFQKRIVQKLAALWKDIFEIADNRTKLLRELLGNIHIIKMYAWEQPFLKKIQDVRAQELALVRARAMYQALSLFLVYAGPAMVAIVSFASFTERNDLPDGWVFNTARAFTSITLFNILRWPLVELPQALNQFVAAKLSIARLEDIFNRPSMDANVSAPMITKKKPMVQMQHCTFAWPEHQDTNFEKELKEAKAKKEQDLLETVPQSKSSKTIAKVALQIKTESSHEESPHAARAVLHEVNLQINHGALVCVIGDTGSGKSSLLNAILGELPPQTSQNWKKPPICLTQGNIGYVAQQAWIFNATVRANICFGKDYHEENYKEAIRVSCLDKDLALFPNGDMTEIGEKGVNMSGGQKQRISIARAVYANADLYLLDDPLSALDAHVARKVFNDCVDGLLKARGATRILATNQLQFLSRADHIVMLGEGTIKAQGSYNDLLQSSSIFQKIVATNSQDEKKADDNSTMPTATTTAPAADLHAGEALGTLVNEEERESGEISWTVISGYIKAMQSNGWLTFIFILFVLAEFGRVASSFWITAWTKGISPDNADPLHDNTWYIWIYCGLAMSQSVFSYFNQLFAALRGVNASDLLLDQMVKALIRAPMSFFHATPLGRILNRFTKDCNDVDNQLVFLVSLFLSMFLQVCLSCAGGLDDEI